MAEKDERSTGIDPGTQLRGTVENKARKPAGLLPKNTQQMVILGVAVVMVLIMWLSSGTKRPSASPSAAPASSVQAPDAATVQDFKQTIQKQQAATRQPISPSALARLRSLGLAGDVAQGDGVAPPDGGDPQSGTNAGNGAPGQQPPPADPVREDRKKRAYLSLFAPNVAFTYRNAREAEQLTGTPSRAPNASPQTDAPGGASAAPDLLEAQLREAQNQLASANRAVELASQTGQQGAAGKPQHDTPQLNEGTKHSNPDTSHPGAFNAFTGKRYVVFEGTVLEALLINRLNGTFAGPVNCLVTNDIYSHDGQRVLIPAGSKVLGEAKKVEAFGQQRLAVFFHRLIMPDGFSVTLDEFKGLSQTGETAVHDKVNNHYLQIFGASLAVGILGGVAQAGTGNVFTNSASDQQRAALGSSLATSSEHILDRFLNVLPTVTIREGSRVKVYLAGDLLLPDYNQHDMQSDI